MSGKPVFAGPVTAAKFNKPPIALIDPDTKEKIRLRLRTMSFQREITDLPVDMLEVHELLIHHRARRNESVYQMVAAWNRLRVHDQYWMTFKFATESEYLAFYGLPDGTTLAGWTIMVNLFDKPTFVLLGDEVLSFMMRLVGEYQQDSDERKKDYQAIFDLYCNGRESFDKMIFFRMVREYVKKKYELPQSKAAGVSHEVWLRQKHTRSLGSTKRREVKPATPDQKFGPEIKQDFVWKEDTCAHCRTKLGVIEAYQEYTKKLETVITKRLGKRHLPHKPPELENL